MKHIIVLQPDRAAAQAEIKAKADTIRKFRVHLAGSKFAGVEADGSRKDWIATSDVRFADPTARSTAATYKPAPASGGHNPAAADLS